MWERVSIQRGLGADPRAGRPLGRGRGAGCWAPVEPGPRPSMRFCAFSLIHCSTAAKAWTVPAPLPAPRDRASPTPPPRGRIPPGSSWGARRRRSQRTCASSRASQMRRVARLCGGNKNGEQRRVSGVRDGPRHAGVCALALRTILGFLKKKKKNLFWGEKMHLPKSFPFVICGKCHPYVSEFQMMIASK